MVLNRHSTTDDDKIHDSNITNINRNTHISLRLLSAIRSSNHPDRRLAGNWGLPGILWAKELDVLFQGERDHLPWLTCLVLLLASMAHETRLQLKREAIVNENNNLLCYWSEVNGYMSCIYAPDDLIGQPGTMAMRQHALVARDETDIQNRHS